MHSLMDNYSVQQLGASSFIDDKENDPGCTVKPLMKFLFVGAVCNIIFKRTTDPSLCESILRQILPMSLWPPSI